MAELRRTTSSPDPNRTTRLKTNSSTSMTRSASTKSTPVPTEVRNRIMAEEANFSEDFSSDEETIRAATRNDRNLKQPSLFSLTSDYAIRAAHDSAEFSEDMGDDDEETDAGGGTATATSYNSDSSNGAYRQRGDAGARRSGGSASEDAEDRGNESSPEKAEEEYNEKNEAAGMECKNCNRNCNRNPLKKGKKETTTSGPPLCASCSGMVVTAYPSGTSFASSVNATRNMMTKLKELKRSKKAYESQPNLETENGGGMAPSYATPAFSPPPPKMMKADDASDVEQQDSCSTVALNASTSQPTAVSAGPSQMSYSAAGARPSFHHYPYYGGGYPTGPHCWYYPPSNNAGGGGPVTSPGAPDSVAAPPPYGYPRIQVHPGESAGYVAVPDDRNANNDRPDVVEMSPSGPIGLSAQQQHQQHQAQQLQHRQHEEGSPMEMVDKRPQPEPITQQLPRNVHAVYQAHRTPSRHAPAGMEHELRSSPSQHQTTPPTRMTPPNPRQTSPPLQQQQQHPPPQHQQQSYAQQHPRRLNETASSPLDSLPTMATRRPQTAAPRAPQSHGPVLRRSRASSPEQQQPPRCLTNAERAARNFNLERHLQQRAEFHQQQLMRQRAQQQRQEQQQRERVSVGDGTVNEEWRHSEEEGMMRVASSKPSSNSGINVLRKQHHEGRKSHKSSRKGHHHHHRPSFASQLFEVGFWTFFLGATSGIVITRVLKSLIGEPGVSPSSMALATTDGAAGRGVVTTGGCGCAAGGCGGGPDLSGFRTIRRRR